MTNLSIPQTIVVEIGKGAGKINLETARVSESILQLALAHGFQQKIADSHSDLKAKDYIGRSGELAKLARQSAELTIEAFYQGLWNQKGGRAADPVAKHAKAIAIEWAKSFFDGLTFGANNEMKLTKDSPAEKRIRQIGEKHKLAFKTAEDVRKLYAFAVQKYAATDEVQEKAKQRAAEDEKNAEAIGDDLPF